jgi:O-antigen/teichoic acid export membrane protein
LANQQFRAVSVVAPAPIYGAIAVADIQAALRTEPPNCVLHQPRKVPRIAGVDGTGAGKVFTDVERLCNVHVPRWLASNGMGEDKIASFYDDPVKQAADRHSLTKAYYLRSLSTEAGLVWRARRWVRFVATCNQCSAEGAHRDRWQIVVMLAGADCWLGHRRTAVRVKLLRARQAARRRLGGADTVARLRAWTTSQSHTSLAQRMAGAALLIRVASAACMYLSQIIFARWMGSSEFGTYVYLWTWVLLIGDLVHLGLAPAAQRFVPQYTQEKTLDLLRGFISGSCWMVFLSAAAVAALLALAARLLQLSFVPHQLMPMYLACAILPAYAVSLMLDGIARSYNWIGLALLPGYILRPLLVVLLMAVAYGFGARADAATAITVALGATWIATAVQAVVLNRRFAATIPAGAKAREVKTWLRTSLPILMVWGFYTLLTYTDILMLQQFRPAADVALYYAASKTIALVAFVYFSVGAAVAHRFSEYHAAGEGARLSAFVAASIRWTFWPSLAAMVVVLALGGPFLSLFGSEFIEAYPLMFVLATGLLARASVGPAERLLSMLGEQRSCAAVYAIAFLLNLILCLSLIPRFGPLGAAIATSAALISESLMLFLIARYRLGIHAFIWQRAGASTRKAVALARGASS